MLGNDGAASLTHGMRLARRRRRDTDGPGTSSVDAASKNNRGSKARNGKGEPQAADDAMVGLIQNAYLRLLVGDSLNARRTLERALASQGIHLLAGEALKTAPLINVGAKHRGEPAAAADLHCRPGDPGRAKVVIRTLGGIEATVNGVNPGSRRKPPYRPLGMLKVLIAHGGCAVSEGAVVDALWPDLDGDHAHDARQVALHRLRKLLGSNDAISVSHGRMFIDDERVWVDALAFETLIRTRVPGGNREKAQIALDLYRGAFLPQEVDAQWTIRMRECLRTKFVNIVAKAAMEMESQGRYSEAAALFERGVAIDDLDDVLHAGVVRCLKKAAPPGVSQTKS